jgi:hypothetical protein
MEVDMPKAAEEDINGTLIRGAAGKLYFIPDDAIERFRVPEERAREVREVLEHAPGILAPAQAAQKENPSRGLRLAVQGPFGRTGQQRNTPTPTDPTLTVTASVRLFLEGLLRK